MALPSSICRLRFLAANTSRLYAVIRYTGFKPLAFLFYVEHFYWAGLAYNTAAQGVSLCLWKYA
ncbi:MAG: hypothetical protein ACYC4K_01340, partial [Thiobacillus sp.]